MSHANKKRLTIAATVLLVLALIVFFSRVADYRSRTVSAQAREAFIERFLRGHASITSITGDVTEWRAVTQPVESPDPRPGVGYGWRSVVRFWDSRFLPWDFVRPNTRWNHRVIVRGSQGSAQIELFLYGDGDAWWSLEWTVNDRRFSREVQTLKAELGFTE